MDPQTVDKALKGAAVVITAVLALIMTRWSVSQLREGGLSRLIASIRGSWRR
jgi:hypothetical protein